jgi:hypothetical protein
MERTKLQIAATVLSAIVHGEAPSLRDKKRLREFAETDEERSMKLDDLARAVILREIERSRERTRSGPML